MIPKFRAWEKNMNEMIPVHDIDFIRKMINARSVWRTFEEIILMQSTGLYIISPWPETGYERKEIFEGDILKWYYSEGIELQQQGIFVVVFENGAFRPGKDSDITLHEMLEDCDYIEVIDNIYETQN